MKKIELKTGLINKCIEIIEENAKTAKEAMDEAQESANEYGLPRDRYDSFRAQVLKKKDMFAQQYQKCQDDLLTFRKINLRNENKQVGFGAFIITSQHKLLIATGMGKVAFLGENYYVISQMTPLYQQMKGLEEGNHFEFNQGKIKILELF